MSKKNERDAITWGAPVIDDSFRLEDGEGRAILDLPCNMIQKVQSTKTDVIIDMKCDEESEHPLLSEIKFAVPTTCKLETKLTGKSKPDTVVQMIKKNMGDSQNHGKLVVEFEDVEVVAPRGTFKLKVFTQGIELLKTSTGGSAEWFLSKKSISTIFLLDDVKSGIEKSKWLCIALKTPIKQGSTNFNCIVLELDGQRPGSWDLELTPELKDVKGASGKNLVSETMEDVPAKVIPQVIQAATGVTILVASKKFEPLACTSSSGREGYLYTIPNCWLFVPQPASLIRFSNIKKVEFEGVLEKANFVFINIIPKDGQKVKYSYANVIVDTPSGPQSQTDMLAEFAREKGIQVSGDVPEKKDDSDSFDSDYSDEQPEKRKKKSQKDKRRKRDE
eukprot:TRINITY_DN3026_c2_g1_i2.p1 TRINITY_DN3026_c2_g1~~TRINITY_DN3026_c2_g1_i2.p1  ORF type:complete len:390 (+),score=72.25 TRINITY_DN3026_c2_g1_i2:88-1257(+)